MKTNMTSRSSKRGFTLVEMIGVLAIIAVLAALLIPRIFQAINEARVNGAALSYNSVKSAAMSHFGKYGRFGQADGTAYALPLAAAIPDYDGILLAGGFTEKPFEVRIGNTSDVVLSPAVSAATAVVDGNAAYDLDGGDDTVNDASAGSVVLEVVITDVALDDARELNRKIDGPTLGEVPVDLSTANPPGPADAPGQDLQGRVKYSMLDGTTGTVRIYIAHK